jgi:hypothetical protein
MKLVKLYAIEIVNDWRCNASETRIVLNCCWQRCSNVTVD